MANGDLSPVWQQRVKYERDSFLFSSIVILVLYCATVVLTVLAFRGAGAPGADVSDFGTLRAGMILAGLASLAVAIIAVVRVGTFLEYTSGEWAGTIVAIWLCWLFGFFLVFVSVMLEFGRVLKEGYPRQKRGREALVGKTVALGITAVFIIAILVAISVPIFLSAKSRNANNVYKNKASALMEKFNSVMKQEGETTSKFGARIKEMETYTDRNQLINAYTDLANTYVPLYQGYQAQTKEISDVLKELTVPQKYRKFHDPFLSSCESLQQALASFAQGIELFRNVTELQDQQFRDIQNTTTRLWNEAENKNKEAKAAWPE